MRKNHLKGREVTVLGGGIGGFAAATALARRGAHVRLLEQAPAISEVGAGLQIGPNGVRVLDALGLAEAARERSVSARGVRLIDGPSGRAVLYLDMARHRPQDPYLFFHRADLLDMLVEGAVASGVTYETGVRVTQVAVREDGAELTIDHATKREVPFLVAADGLHSVVRPEICGRREPFFTGQVAWRALLPGDGRAPPEAQVRMGPGRHLVTYPLRGGEVLNLVAVEERAQWAEEGWFNADDPDNLRRAFAGFAPDTARLLEQVEEVHIWGLFRHEVAEQWHRGAGVLLGDAAHPTLPFMAQGAVMALEDAWVLADCLSKQGMVDGPALYQARRRHRVARIVDAASKNARNYHYANPVARFLGHNALRVAGRLAPRAMLGRFDWIYGHNVTLGG